MKLIRHNGDIDLKLLYLLQGGKSDKGTMAIGNGKREGMRELYVVSKP